MSDPFLTQTTMLRRLRDPADDAAWADFCALYHPLIVRFVRSHGIDINDAEDVAQDLFATRLRGALAAFVLDRTRGKFRTWLWQVTLNALRDMARQRQAQARLKDGLRDLAAAADTSTSQIIEKDWETQHRKAVLAFALAKVKSASQPATWACFEQHILKARPAADVAADLGASESAVYTNAHRIMARVRETCWEYDEDMAEGDAQ